MSLADITSLAPPQLTSEYMACRAMHKLLFNFGLSSHYPIRSKLTLIWLEHANHTAMDLYNGLYEKYKT